MKVLITGASGFIGNRTLRALYSFALETKAAARSDIFGVPTEIVGAIDSCTDWNRALEQVDTVIHLAAYAHGSPRSDKIFYEVNFEGTKNLAKQAKKHGVRKFIYLGSIGSVRRVSYVPLKETDKPEPDTPYTKSKFYGEEAVRDIFPGQYTILRAPAVFGKGCKGNLRTLLRLRNIPIPMNKEAVRALIDVELLSNFLAQTASREPLGTVHVANPEEIALSELANIIGIRSFTPPRPILKTINAIGVSLFRESSSRFIPLFEPLRVSTDLQKEIFGDVTFPLRISLNKWIKEETSQD